MGALSSAYPLFFLFLFSSRLFFFALLSLSPHSRNSDPGPQSRLFSPLPTTVRAFIFIARRVHIHMYKRVIVTIWSLSMKYAPVRQTRSNPSEDATPACLPVTDHCPPMPNTHTIIPMLACWASSLPPPTAFSRPACPTSMSYMIRVQQPL